MKKSLFDSLFLVILVFSHGISMCFENILCKATFSVKKGFGMIPK